MNYPYDEATNAEAFHARFTVRSLMIAVAIAAGLLTLPSVWSVPLIAIACPVVAFVSAQRQLARGSRRLSAIWFWVVAILSNLMYAALCLYPISFVLTGLVIELLFIIPTILSFGCAWATMTTRNSVPAQRASSLAWAAVVVLALTPIITLLTLWPLRLVFFLARPTMDILADQVVAGSALRGPRWVGPWRLLGSDLSAGNARLLVDPNPGNPSGFVRAGQSRPHVASDVLNLDLHLGGGWWYEEED